MTVEGGDYLGSAEFPLPVFWAGGAEVKMVSRFPLILKAKRLARVFLRSNPASPFEVERGEWMFYLNYLRQGMVVFDVGSYVGELTLLFSRFVGENGQVHSFEASSMNFHRLKTIMNLANHKNVVLNHMALAEKEGIVKLYTYDDQLASWSTLADRPLEEYGIVKPVALEEVLATTIDIYCEQNRISRIDLLKIDVEGAEYQVLLGARSMLKSKRILCCTFEFGQTTFDIGNNPNEIENYLKQMGYEIRNIVKGNQIFPGRSSVKTARFSMHIATPKIL